MELVILVGPPGSGKSTLAEKNYLSYVYVNQDLQGKNGHRETFLSAVANNKPIVLDRMNFSRDQRKFYTDQAKSNGYRVIVITLFVPYKVCLDRVLQRINHPTIKDHENAINALDLFFRSYEPATEDEGILIRSGFKHAIRPEAIICDLDGTLCNIDHRLHYVKKEKPEWPSFLEACGDDVPNNWCVKLLKSLEQDYPIVLCSGRPEQYRNTTVAWLEKYGIRYDNLFMRPHLDYRKDSLIKEILLDFEILPRYTPLFVVDDRKQVTDMWRGRGITCLQCEEGNF